MEKTDDLNISPNAAKDYGDRVNPNFSTRVESIGRATALIYEGVELVPSLQMKLFGKFFKEGQKPTFDYVDLNLEEIIEHTAEDTESIKQEFERYKERGQVDEKGVLTHPHFKGMDFERFKSETEKSRKADLDNMSPWVPGEQIRPADQEEKIDSDLLDLFGDNSEEVEKKFQEVIKKDPKKPFLIIHGHGDTEDVGSDQEEGFSNNKSWNLGGENLSVIFEKVDPSKYSAILIVACNEDQIKPPKVKGPVVFYDERLIGLGVWLDENIKRTPTKYTEN